MTASAWEIIVTTENRVTENVTEVTGLAWDIIVTKTNEVTANVTGVTFNEKSTQSHRNSSPRYKW